jgi:hypothetical protein
MARLIVVFVGLTELLAHRYVLVATPTSNPNSVCQSNSSRKWIGSPFPS